MLKAYALESDAVYEEAVKLPFVAEPTRYRDRIRPLLNASQRDLCDHIIRQTYGWHRPRVKFDMKKILKTSCFSERTIKTAKKALLDTSPTNPVRNILKRDGNLFYINIFFDRVKEIKVDNGNNNINSVDNYVENVKEGIEDFIESEQKNIVNESIVEQVDMQTQEQSESATLSPAPYIEIPGSIIDLKKQTNETEEKKEKVVCSLKNVFQTVESKDRAIFLNRVVSKYELEAIEEKLVVMAEYEKYHEIKDRKRFLIAALERNFEPNYRAEKILKAKQAAEISMQKFREECDELRSDEQKRLTTEKTVNAWLTKNQLQDEIRKQALSALSTYPEFLITGPLIDSKIREIALSQM